MNTDSNKRFGSAVEAYCCTHLPLGFRDPNSSIQDWGKLHCAPLFNYIQTHFLGLKKHETEKTLKLQGWDYGTPGNWRRRATSPWSSKFPPTLRERKRKEVLLLVSPAFCERLGILPVFSNLGCFKGSRQYMSTKEKTPLWIVFYKQLMSGSPWLLHCHRKHHTHTQVVGRGLLWSS